MSTFDLRKFLTENRLTTNSKMLENLPTVGKVNEIKVRKPAGNLADMENKIREYLGKLEEDLLEDGVYMSVSDSDMEYALKSLLQGDADSAVDFLLVSIGTQDGGEPRHYMDIAQDLQYFLEEEFKDILNKE